MPKVEPLKSISENIELNPEDDINAKISKSDSHINQINACSFKDMKNTDFKNIPEKTEENLQEVENLPQENDDQFEEEEDEFREFTLPADLLPEGTDEGEYLTIRISREAEKTQKALDEARELLQSS